MIDAIDELVARSKQCSELQDFHDSHRKHPEVLDFLVQEIELRIERGFSAFSFPSLWSYARWKLEVEKGPLDTFKLNDHLTGFYGRAIVILHPEFNGRAECRPALADEIFWLQIAATKQPEDYARRLEWKDSTPIAQGWRPTIPHTLHAVARKPDIH